MPERRLRLFLAFWPDNRQRAQLTDSLRGILDAGGFRAVPSENLHVTIVFVGSIARTALAELITAVGSVAQQPLTSPICLTFDRIEYWSKADVLCATAPPSDVASRLAARWKSQLASCGFSPDEKPFRPHVTLGRKVTRSIRASRIAPVRWCFREAVLVASSTGAAGSSYSTLQRWSLCGEHAENT
ncbi:MAG: RNA 2',3'-cyclic phosphodiesterase [Sinobacteraceae bacterium]|nr:RNA 2',3'-cyclic phosphodiesterase [Nevskiaceae bacterium]MBV9912393.1 RNA 2',3'-cyclic phosphodiesterase [Nevskiaceae bacterium]